MLVLSASEAAGLPEEPLVTVVTPSYNYGRYLGDCLASVRAQDHPHIQHVVLDAHSSDATAEVIDSFRGTYRLEAIVQNDEGQADALNKGFARASGDVFAWLNADDYWLHERVVSEAVASLVGGADIVTADGYFVDQEGVRIRQHLPPFLAKRHDVGHLRKDLRHLDPILQPATFWRREVHRPLRQDMHYAFDWQFFLDMLEQGARLEVLDSDWAAYRWHGDNKSSDDPSERRGEIASVLRSEWGTLSPQYLWAAAVYRGLRVAERLDSDLLAKGVRKTNSVMGRVTRYRVFSC